MGCTCDGPCMKKWFTNKENILLVATISSVVLGLSVGFLLRLAEMDELQVSYYKFLADLLLSMLKAILLPLIMFSMIGGIASLNASTTGKMGGITVGYYMATTVIAVILGIILVTSIKPGKISRNKDFEIDKVETDDDPTTALDTILDLVRNMFPENLVQMTFQRVRTFREENERNVTNANGDPVQDPVTGEWITESYLLLKFGTGSGYNVLGMITVSVCTGIALVITRDEIGEALTKWFNDMTKISMTVVWWIIWFSPIGIFFLVSGEIIAMDDPAESFSQLAFYMITVMTGLLIHFFLILPLLYWLFSRKNPYTFMMGLIPALLTAFGTASSSATLPVTLANLENVNHVDRRVTSFVLPIGATINMDGTALYEAVAALFIAQFNDIDLSFGDIIVVALTATVAAIGAAGIPSGGLVTMMMVLNAIGLPEDDVGLILSVDWLLDRFRTMTNVWGDSVGCGIVDSVAIKYHWFDRGEIESVMDGEDDNLKVMGDKSEAQATQRQSDNSDAMGPASDPVQPNVVLV